MIRLLLASLLVATLATAELDLSHLGPGQEDVIAQALVNRECSGLQAPECLRRLVSLVLQPKAVQEAHLAEAIQATRDAYSAQASALTVLGSQLPAVTTSTTTTTSSSSTTTMP